MLIAKNIENNTMYSVQELHLFLCSAIFTSSIFSVHSSVSLSTNFSCTYNFYYLDILQHHMIYHIHIHNHYDSKYILFHIHLYQSILCIHTCIFHHSNVVYFYKCLHLITFHAIICVFFISS